MVAIDRLVAIDRRKGTRMADVLIFAPAPLLTVTLEGDHPDGDLHVHSGGQGVWQARMLRTLGRSVSIVGTFTGESGRVVRHLLADEGIEVHALHREGRGPAYVHDRRTGRRTAIAELAGDPLSRHDLDELYAAVLREAMACRLVILSGPSDDILSDDVYRRLAADLAAERVPVVVDLAGPRLRAALAGTVRLAMVSDSELRESGELRGDTLEEVIAAGRRLRDAGARSVVVTRADEPLVLINGEHAHLVRVPRMQEVDATGAGDSLLAAIVSALVEDEPLLEAVALGAAAGALNVTRHGLGTGDPEAIHRLRKRVTVEAFDGDDGAEQFTLDQLAARAEVDES
jgi:1-phosphofructokinase